MCILNRYWADDTQARFLQSIFLSKVQVPFSWVKAKATKVELPQTTLEDVEAMWRPIESWPCSTIRTSRETKRTRWEHWKPDLEQIEVPSYSESFGSRSRHGADVHTMKYLHVLHVCMLSSWCRPPQRRNSAKSWRPMRHIESAARSC